MELDLILYKNSLIYWNVEVRFFYIHWTNFLVEFVAVSTYPQFGSATRTSVEESSVQLF